MVIAKGESWGEPAPDLHVATQPDDRALAVAALAALDADDHLVASVGPGEVRAQLGVPDERPVGERYRYPFDLGLVRIDGERQPFVAHLVARRPRWAGEFAVAMNTGWLGSWYLGPRAHPNDGLVDVTVGRLDWRQRLAARRRAATGSHLPHPDLTVVRRATWAHRFGRPVTVTVDGHRVGAATEIEIEVLPDALTVVV